VLFESKEIRKQVLRHNLSPLVRSRLLIVPGFTSTKQIPQVRQCISDFSSGHWHIHDEQSPQIISAWELQGLKNDRTEKQIAGKIFAFSADVEAPSPIVAHNRRDMNLVYGCATII
jgi:hypothetical protein